jgi:hypothetical protein
MRFPPSSLGIPPKTAKNPNCVVSLALPQKHGNLILLEAQGAGSLKYWEKGKLKEG